MIECSDVPNVCLCFYVDCYILQKALCSASYPPCSQWQCLDPHYSGLDVAPESDHTNDDTQNVDDVVTIGRYLVDAAAITAEMFVCLTSTFESLRDKNSLKLIGFGWGCRR